MARVDKEVIQLEIEDECDAMVAQCVSLCVMPVVVIAAATNKTFTVVCPTYMNPEQMAEILESVLTDVKKRLAAENN